MCRKLPHPQKLISGQEVVQQGMQRWSTELEKVLNIQCLQQVELYLSVVS
jgi:hypothetical protein